MKLKETASSRAVGKTYISKPRQMSSWITKPKEQAGEWYAGILALWRRATELERRYTKRVQALGSAGYRANELFLHGDYLVLSLNSNIFKSTNINNARRLAFDATSLLPPPPPPPRPAPHRNSACPPQTGTPPLPSRHQPRPHPRHLPRGKTWVRGTGEALVFILVTVMFCSWLERELKFWGWRCGRCAV